MVPHMNLLSEFPCPDAEDFSQLDGFDFWHALLRANQLQVLDSSPEDRFDILHPSEKFWNLTTEASPWAGRLRALMDLIYERAKAEDMTDVLFAHAKARGDRDVLSDRASSGVLSGAGYGLTKPVISSDVLTFLLEEGSDEDINRAAQDCANHVDPENYIGFDTYFASRRGRFYEPLETIRAAARKYCRDKKLNSQRMTPHLSDVNGAVELNDYDLVIGIAQGGIALPALMDFMGKPTAFLRSSRETQSTKWLTLAPTKASRLLICEDDARTGGTLDRIMPALDALNPTDIHICFTGCGLGVSKDIATKSGHFDKVFDTLSVPFTSFTENVRKVESASRSRVPRTPPSRC